MSHYCKNHPTLKAISFCYSCKEYYCADCLEEGSEYYYCNKDSCKQAKDNESFVHDEVEKSKNTDLPKLLIEGKAVTFCDRCIFETNTGPIQEGLFSKSSATLKNERDKCEECGSVIMDLEEPILFGLFFRGIINSYRIIKTNDLDPDALYLHRSKYISRELKA